MAKISPALRIALGFVLFACFLGVGTLVAALVLDAPTDRLPDEGLLFVVERGETFSAVANRLEREGIVKSAFYAQLLARLGIGGKDLKAGAYKILPGMGTLEVLRFLETGKQSDIKVTIPEGLTKRLVAKLLEERKILKASNFLEVCADKTILAEFGIEGADAEGYLYPDTYNFVLDQPPQDVLRIMVGTFFRRLAESVPAAAGMTKAEVRDRVILASIVEREYRVADEAPLIASVFHNRVAKKMGLESCATVVYVITEIKGKKHPKKLYYLDLEIDDPYNTYKWAGLPPGPIANPGLVALQAAFSPAETDYLFFRLVDPQTGRHKFSRTLAEHDSAASLWVKE